MRPLNFDIAAGIKLFILLKLEAPRSFTAPAAWPRHYASPRNCNSQGYTDRSLFLLFPSRKNSDWHSLICSSTN